MITSVNRLALSGAAVLLVSGTAVARIASPASELRRDVEIIRTEHGVPHIRAKTLRAGGYGLAWVMSEDYGTRTVMNVLRGSGNMGRVFGRDSIEYDFASWRDKQRAMETYHRLE